MSKLHERIIEISRKHKLSHLGSCLTAVDIIEEIFNKKKRNEKFILSCGHAGLALYVVMESKFKIDAESLLEVCGIHPKRVRSVRGCSIDCSTGSLGQGLPIAVGMALSDRSKNVYCLISDGEAMEGSIYEAANVIRKYKVDNLKVYMNFNGWGAYDPIPVTFKEVIKAILPNIIIRDTNFDKYDFLNGQDAHYCTI